MKQHFVGLQKAAVLLLVLGAVWGQYTNVQVKKNTSKSSMTQHRHKGQANLCTYFGALASQRS